MESLKNMFELCYVRGIWVTCNPKKKSSQQRKLYEAVRETRESVTMYIILLKQTRKTEKLGDG